MKLKEYHRLGLIYEIEDLLEVILEDYFSTINPL